MWIIYNKYYPFKPFYCQNILGIIICRGKKGCLDAETINHEYIHTLQQRELLYLGFFLWYHIEWLVKWIQTGSRIAAYRSLGFEREAYDNERDLQYAQHRQPYAWFYRYANKGTFLHEWVDFLREICCFLRDDFRWSKYLYVALWALALVIGQTWFQLYDHLIAPSYAAGTSMFRLAMVYCFIYYAVLIPTLLLHREGWRLRQWQVWVLPALLVAADGAAQGFDAYRGWIHATSFSSTEKVYLNLVSSFLFRSVAIIIILCGFRWTQERRFALYGLKHSGRYLRIYCTIFFVLLPLFVLVSLTPQFLAFYPKMNITHYANCFAWSEWQLMLPFELSYANDFLAVEGLFRGALVIGLSRWLGARAVLPMAVVYMSVHLGKPDLELCSSIIGGYILGILAYRTCHLWGGIIVHLGIALFFELLGLFHLGFF